jgi:hypothetical protein
MSHRTHHGHLVELHTEHVVAEYGTVCLCALALLLVLALAGCAGNGPLGSGLGTVVGDIAVTDPNGNKCNVTIKNGKDQTNLQLEDLDVCGAHLGKLHADRSDGAQAAIAANAQVMTSLGGQLIGLLGGVISMLAPVPVPHGPAPAPAPRPVPPVIVIPPPPPPPPAMLESTEL